MQSIRALAAALLGAALCAQAFGQAATVVQTGDSGGERAAPQVSESDAAVPPKFTGAALPFGHRLFRGGFRGEREDGVNPGYIIAPGDQINVRTWGATSFENILTVDSQGNIFIPEIGPIRVAGVRNDALNSVVQRAVRTVFTSNVGVYTNLQGTQPVVVYVTGFVNEPGSYAGVSTDSVLYFLDRAGGVDLRRGSFRNIKLVRAGQTAATVDLYRFLLDGEIVKPQFIDGDTIVVGPQSSTLVVEGAVRNAFAFEFAGGGLDGRRLIELARPDPEVSHLTLTGTRDGTPVSAYLALAELETLQLRPGDRVIFEEDRRKQTMLIRVEGKHLGLSRYAVPVNTRLGDLLDHIPVDPQRSAIESISLRRVSVAERQAKAIEDSLRRLETTVLGATSQTDDEARIRLEEAKLVSQFVARARELEPEGVLVVARDGQIEDIVLQPEDVVTIPERTGTVLVSGEVLVPQAVVYQPGADIEDYLQRVGGLTDRADTDRFLVIRRNAEVVQGTDPAVQEGDEIVVLPEVPVKSLELVKSITQIIFQLALSTATVLRL